MTVPVAIKEHFTGRNVLRTMTLVLLGIALTATPLLAQGLERAGIFGVVSDESGGILPGVTVTITSLTTTQSRTTLTDERGLYRFAGLVPSQYSIAAELQGFAKVVQSNITLNVGSDVGLNMVMKLSSVAEEVTVTGQSAIVEAAKTDLSTVITKQDLETLPTNGRSYLDFTLLTPTATLNTSTPRQGVYADVGAARSYETSLLVDGFWNTDELFGAPRHVYSQDAIQEYQVVSSGGTAEFGRAIGAVVSAITKSGSNAFHGSAFGFFRNQRLNAETVIERQQGLPKGEFNRKQVGGTFGGPLVKGKTFFFSSFERSPDNTPVNNLITAANAKIVGLPPEDVGTVLNFRHVTFGMAKVDHSLNDQQRLQVSAVYTHNDNYGNRQETYATRSKLTHQQLWDKSFQLGWTDVAGKWLHELKGSYFPRNNISHGVNAGGPPLVPDGQIDQLRPPRVSITNVASFGPTNLDNTQVTRPGQVQYASSVFANAHSIKFGADVMYANFDYFLYTNTTGTYTFRDLPSFLNKQYSTYTQLFGDLEVVRDHAYVAAYLQDSWTVNNRLTLNYGLRYDVEKQPSYKGVSFGHDYNNFGPRAAVSYDLTGKGKTFLKTSAGILYDRIFLNYSTTLFYNWKEDPQQFSASWNFGQAGAPTYPNNFSSLPPGTSTSVRNVRIFSDELNIPSSRQVLVALDHGFAKDWALTSSLIYTVGRNEDMLFDRNLQFNDATQTWTRPDPTVRSISQSVFDSPTKYTGGVLEVRKRGQKFNIRGNITLARSYNMTTAFGSQPNDQRFPDAEWGPATDTPTFRGVVSGGYRLTNQLQLSGIYSGQTGLAVDPSAGASFDLNGDGRFNDRPPTFGRNSFRGPGTQNLDLRLAWSVPIKKEQRVQFFFETFNVFNRDNVTGVNSTYGPTPGQPLALFLTPTTYGLPRQIQLAARLDF